MFYIYIFISLIFIFLSIKVTKKILNPIFIFVGTWLAIIVLYQFELSNWQYNLIDDSYITFIINIMAFTISYLLVYIFKRKKMIQNNEKKDDKNVIVDFNFIKKMFIFWIIIEIIETIYSGGIPIIWKLVGSSKTYASYGIPTVHGLMNSISLIIMLLSYYLYLKENRKNKKLLLIIGTIILFDLMIITRQVIVSALIELFVIYIFFNKKIPVYKLLIIVSFLVSGFGLIGNIRTGSDNFIYVSSFKNENINKFLIGFYWVYMYFTMSIANINNAIYLGINQYGLYPIMKNYLPTVFSNIIFENSNIIIPNYLVTKAFNVSGYFINFYLAFGNLGVLIISSIYGVLGGIITNKNRNESSEKNLLYMSVYIQIIILSFFENHLFYLPSGFQFFLIFLIFKYIDRNMIRRKKYA